MFAELQLGKVVALYCDVLDMSLLQSAIFVDKDKKFFTLSSIVVGAATQSTNQPFNYNNKRTAPPDLSVLR